jgi:hypothetical protein
MRHASAVLRVTRLNAIPAPYAQTMEIHDELFERRKQDAIRDTVIILQVWRAVL